MAQDKPGKVSKDEIFPSFVPEKRVQILSKGQRAATNRFWSKTILIQICILEESLWRQCGEQAEVSKPGSEEDNFRVLIINQPEMVVAWPEEQWWGGKHGPDLGDRVGITQIDYESMRRKTRGGVNDELGVR